MILLATVGTLAAGVYLLKDAAINIAGTLPTVMQQARDTLISELGFSAQVIGESSKAAGIMGRETLGGPAGEQTTTTAPVAVSVIQRVVSGISAFAGHLVVVIFLIYFLLIEGHRVRSWLVEIAGPDPHRRRTTSKIIDDINTQIQRYLLVLLVTAIIVAAATWAALALIGVRNAAVWGLV